MDGILLIDKCGGETSHDVVRKTRFAFRGKNPVKVGHAGTLDPFATGLLVILVGQGTKLSPFIMAGEKVYLATLQLGVETDTLDLTGRVVATSPVPAVTRKQVEETARQFVGRLHQVPPAFSAVRYRGKRAYRLAREGQRVELEAREITVHSLEILSAERPNVTFRVRCSSGTYVRRLASDLAGAVGTVGHLQSLRRVRSGPFEVKDALSSAEIGVRGASMGERVIPLTEALPHMAEIPVRPEMAEKVRQGVQPLCEDLIPAEEQRERGRPVPRAGWVKLVDGAGLVAIGHADAENGDVRQRFSIDRVFLS